MRAGTLAPADRARLSQESAERPEAATAVLETAARRRDGIYRLFSALAARRSPPVDDLRTGMAAYASSIAAARFDTSADGLQPRWPPGVELEGPLMPIAYSAGILLVSADIELVKECPGCGWLFLDRSRNRSRRWCDMRVCGSRDKMRRYYRSRRADRSM